MNVNETNIFVTFRNFKNIFLKRFIDFNLIETTIKKLLIIKQERMFI